MKIRIVLDDKDAGLLLRVLDEGASLHTGHPRRQERLDAVVESIHRQLEEEFLQARGSRAGFKSDRPGGRGWPICDG